MLKIVYLPKQRAHKSFGTFRTELILDFEWHEGAGGYIT